MGDYNAIYEAGQSLVELLKKEMTPLPISSPEAIGLCAPHEPEDYQLTVWTFNIEEYNDSGANSSFLPDPNNLQQERFAPMQLRCHTLISAHSKAPIPSRLTDEYRIIGRAMQIVRDNPTIPQNNLVGSLANEGAGLQLTYIKLSNDEMNKIWNTANKLVKPSFALSISTVTIESNRIRPAGARVSRSRISLEQK